MRVLDRGRRGQTRRLAVMAIAAVMLATVVATSFSGGGTTDQEDPRASFTFERDGTAVVITHFGGDTLDGATVSVRSGRGVDLGTMAGSQSGTDAGDAACATPVTEVRQGTTCRVPDVAFEQLYVVYNGPGNRTLILAQRRGDPTPTPVPTTTGAPTLPGTESTPTETGASRTPTASGATTTPAGATPTVVPTPTGTLSEPPTPTGTGPPPEGSPATGSPTATNGTAGGP